jgi:aminoglycoside phosphotransferase (APT) family kinase protein
MPIFEQRDQEQARRSLSTWLARQLPGAADVLVSELGGPAATGYSNETILLDASWREGGEEHHEGFAVRVKPSSHTVFLESEFETQYRVLKILGEKTDIPVPRVSWYEEDTAVLGAPFFVMDQIAGRVPGDSPAYTMGGWPCEASPQEQERLWWNGVEVMARIHRLDWQSLGLDFLVRPERGRTGLDQQLTYYQAYFEWAAHGRPQPSVQAVWDWLLANRPADQSPDGLCWGDSRIGNMIFDDQSEVRAVLDWEMVALGNPLQDLAWWLFLDRYQSEGYGVAPLPGFPGRDATVARWQELTGRNADHLDWHERWAAFRFGVVMIRIAQLLVHFELLPPDSDLERNNGVTQLIDDLLVRA